MTQILTKLNVFGEDESFKNENNKKQVNADILYAQELSTVIQLNPDLLWYILVPSVLRKIISVLAE